jgi:hypothetical protein
LRDAEEGTGYTFVPQAGGGCRSPRHGGVARGSEKFGRRCSRSRWPTVWTLRESGVEAGVPRVMAGGASRRYCASPLNRLGLGLCRWGGCGAGEFCAMCRWPPPPFIWRSATGAHQLDRAGTPPIRARERARPSRIRWDSEGV